MSVIDNTSIQMNKNSQLYKLPDVFDVYKQSKSQLNVPVPVPASDTEFKNDGLKDIYHLTVSNDLNSNSIKNNLTTAGPGPDVNNGSRVAEASPPGLNPTAINPDAVPNASRPKLMNPSQINWYYLDQSSNQQGPFNGDLMQGWYNDGYLSRDLPVKIENGEFQSLDAFCKSVNNYINPFQVPLPDPTTIANSVSGTGIGPNPVEPLGGPQQASTAPLASTASANGSIPSLLPQLNNSFQNPLFDLNYPFQMNNNFGQIQNPVIPRPNSSWGLDYSSLASINMNQMPFNSLIQPSISQQTVHPTPISPWVGSRVQSLSRVNSPFVAEPGLNLGSAVSGILNDLDPVEPPISQVPYNQIPVQQHQEIEQPNVVVPEEISQPNVVVPEEIEQPVVVVPEEIEQPVVVVPEEIQQPIVVVPEETNPSEPEVVSAPVVASQEVKAKNPTKSVEKPGKNVEDAVEELLPKIETLKPSVSTKESRAPWAKEVSSTPKLTLKEIQRLENEKFEKQKKEEAQKILEAQAALLKEESEKESEKKKSLPSTIGWGNASSNMPKVTKTLAEIQAEELRLAEAAKKKSTPTLASTLSNSNTTTTEEGWSTVAKKITKKTSAPVLNRSSSAISSSSTNPQVLRTVSSNTVTPKQDNSQNLREEFLIWARSQMTNLYPLVSANDLLEMFVALPNNQDSLQLISETIYSSSTTMNSRAFAQEFLKKKTQYNKQISNSDDLSAWSAAIISSSGKVPTTDEDGWSTTKRKKGRK